MRCTLHSGPCTLFPATCTLKCAFAAHFSKPVPPPLLPPPLPAHSAAHARNKPPAKDASSNPSAAGATKTSQSTSSASGPPRSASKASTSSKSDEYEIPRRYGLICTMGYAGGGTIPDALNRVENHDAIEAAFRKNIPIAAKAGVPNVITFSGNRRGMSDEEGARNTIARAKPPQAHRRSQRRDHLSRAAQQQASTTPTTWPTTLPGARASCTRSTHPASSCSTTSTTCRLWRGDLIDTIRQNIGVLGHFHTGGVPGRHEIDATQEIQYAAVMKAIADSGFCWIRRPRISSLLAIR
jgi:hypothetical protein